MYPRILLKLSGEAFMGKLRYGLDGDAIRKIALEIAEIRRLGIQIGLVVGGGNIFRGAKASGLALDRTPADQIGMLATVMNGLALSQALKNLGLPVRVMSSFPCGTFVETYSWEESIRALDAGEIVIFVGGSGNPYFTTDSAAALRAAEIKANLLLKATTVDGVYDTDPKQSKDAVKYEKVSYSEVLERKLQVMDAAAIVICRENRIPIRVIDIFGENNLKNAILNERVGTLVEGL
jgi:uridylate kinase